MSGLVEINLGKGNLEEGFDLVTVKIDKKTQCTSSLPPSPELQQIYYRWLSFYQSLYQSRRFAIRQRQPVAVVNNFEDDDDDDFEIDEDDITHVCEEDFTDICLQLENSLNQWLGNNSFVNTENKLRQQLPPEKELIFVLESEDYLIKKIPWHLWQFFDDYPLTEISLSNLYFKPRATIFNKSKKVRVLAILGDSTGIDVQSDRQILTNLENTETLFLVEPTIDELYTHLLAENGWDILFFSGHSETNIAENYTGYMYLNQQEKLTMEELKNGIKKATDNGLQLAILNSCDGLGLGKQLADLSIPQTILMRESIADQVAQQFLQSFLDIFSHGQSLYLSVKEAREKLKTIENQFPAASWLPVIWQNPAVIPPVWQDLCFTPTTLKRKINQILSASVAVFSLIIGVFSLTNQAEAREFEQNNSLIDLGNYLQQQTLNLQQFNNYLKADFNEEYLDNQLIESIDSISSQLQDNSLPSISDLNFLNDSFNQQLQVDNTLSLTENVNDGQVNNKVTNPQSTQNLENLNQINSSSETQQLLNSVEQISDSLEEFSADIDNLNITIEQINENNNLWLEDINKIDRDLQAYKEDLAVKMNDNEKMLTEYSELLKRIL